MGLRWATDPGGAAAGLGMTLLDGVGRSSQIGDGGGLFLSMGVMILIGLVTSNRTWFFAPALVLGLIAVLRVLASLVHDAALAMDMITERAGRERHPIQQLPYRCQLRANPRHADDGR
jgi:hypothetical protein